MNSIRIASAVCHCPVSPSSVSLSCLKPWLITAAKYDVQLITFPELNLTGYVRNERALKLATTIPGPETRELTRLAHKYSLVIMAGLVEKDQDEKLFISHVVAFPDGSIGVYRKLHLGPPERSLFFPGMEVPTFNYLGLSFGIQLCYDAHFPELTTAMALKGVDIVFIPHASPRGTPQEKVTSWMRHLPARAFDNGIYVMACNPVGHNGDGLEFPGVAMILGPSGDVLAKEVCNTEKLFWFDLDLEFLNQVRKHPMRYFLPHRRTDIIDTDFV